MRFWSIHPCYLDTKGLGGLWYEVDRGKNALNQGSSHGDWNHSALHRFKKYNKQYPGGKDTMDLINSYMDIVYKESLRRGFNYDNTLYSDKPIRQINKIPVNRKQVIYEMERLSDKLEKRESYNKHNKLMESVIPKLHPLFYMVNGDIEDWEKGA